ncbi:PKD domain-containing protein [Methanolobus sp. WCC4]|uniref:PKD domain-containing protein n=1 Tax=Methanolobus sp. WCC4 TaxID=3125784 RepID=UPI0030F5EA33
MNRKLILPIIIMLALVVLLSGIMNFQAAPAQEEPDSDDSGPVVEEPVAVAQKAAPAPVEQTTTTVNSTPAAPAPTPTSTYYGGGGSFAASSEEDEEEKEDDKKTPVIAQEMATTIVVADFSYETKCLTVNFTDISENATSWSWDFGDGNTSTEQNPDHIYATEDTYVVNLTVSNAETSDSVEKRISVLECAEEPKDSDKIPEDEVPAKVQEEIPEFPTVAIPMIAIIGMAFFFSRRQ